MLKDIIDKYGSFSDSWINSVETSKEPSEIKISITCSNHLNNYKYETIHLILRNIIFSNIDRFYLKNIMALKKGLLERKGDFILLDFDPIDHFDYLNENSDSSFIVNFKEIEVVFVKYLDC